MLRIEYYSKAKALEHVSDLLDRNKKVTIQRQVIEGEVSWVVEWH